MGGAGVRARGLAAGPRRHQRAEWSEALGAQIAAAPDEDYYRCWLVALERLVDAREPGALARHRDAWARAAARTPHGKPIELAPTDF